MSNKVTNVVAASRNEKCGKDNMEADDYLKKPKKSQENNTTFHNTAKEFTEEIDILGLKYLCRENTHLFRKFLYLVFVLFGSGFAIYQIVDQVGTSARNFY